MSGLVRGAARTTIKIQSGGGMVSVFLLLVIAVELFLICVDVRQSRRDLNSLSTEAADQLKRSAQFGESVDKLVFAATEMRHGQERILRALNAGRPAESPAGEAPATPAAAE